MQGCVIEGGVRIAPFQVWGQPWQTGGVLGEMPQGDAGTPRYRKELLQRGIQLKNTRRGQLDQHGSGERLAQRADLDV
jgi:hypothetical protein